MSLGVVSPVLNHLSALIVNEAKLLGGLRQDIQHIVDELEHMKAFLMVAEGREEEDPQLQVWTSQVRDVACDIQDAVDEFLLRFTRHRGRSFHGVAGKIFHSMKNLPARYKTAHNIQDIKSRITNISESHKRYQSEYGLANQSTASSSSSSVAVNNSWRDNYRDEALLVEETKLVGIDRPKQQIISQLLDGGDAQLKVVSVHGMGGIGKTTLVKKIQEDAYVKGQFRILAWVTVSQTWDMKELLKDLIQKLYQEIQKAVPQHVDTITATDGLKEHVKEFLQDKRYLIVFDDVWHVNFWDGIKLAMPEGSCGNRVMLTTRIEDVARAPIVEFQSYVHDMQPLSPTDSWTLFCKKTFKDNCCPAHLETVAKEILRKCKGLPLGIVSIGGLLALKDESKIEEWKMVERSLGSQLESNANLNPVTKILLLSYNELPYHLKTCLLSASIFPEDYMIIERRLIPLWIAEGFVLEETGMTKYEVARTYLHELTNRSLIQVSSNINNPIFKFYHIHDLLREIILSKSSRQNFATIATGKERRWPKKVRRLAIQSFKCDTKESSCFKYVRSLVAFNSKEPLPRPFLSELLSGGSGLLKILDLEGTQLEEIPEEIFRLFNLKTLRLSHTRIKVIPKSIGSLKNLEYLDLGHTKVSELPEEILKIEGLVHLIVFEIHSNIHYRGFNGPKRIAKLRSLEWLYCIQANEISIREIGELKQLRVLGVSNLRREHGKQIYSSLGNLSNLEELSLHAQGIHEVLDLEDMNISLSSSLQNLQRLHLHGGLERISQLVPSLQGLTTISLNFSRLTMDDPLESLQHLPNLRHLQLAEAFEGERLCFKAKCFLKLQNLLLCGLQNLRWLRVEDGTMPNLVRLDIRSLRLLEEFPWGVQYLTKLQSLYLDKMSDQLTAQLQNCKDKEESENYQKISHIPQILIWDEEHGWCRL